MTAHPIVTGCRLDDTPGHRILHYSCDPDLQVKLATGGHNVGGDSGMTLVLVALDVDGMPSDSVDVQAPDERVDSETLDRAVAALQLVRDALGRTA